MLGHNVMHVPMEDKVEKLPWFVCDLGVRRLAWGLTLALGLYWGWFLYHLAEAMREGFIVPKVLVGLIPVFAVAWVELVRPRAGAVMMITAGLAGAVFAPTLVVSLTLLGLSLAAGGLMYFSAHR